MNLFELAIYHYFGTVDSEIRSEFGIYLPHYQSFEIYCPFNVIEVLIDTSQFLSVSQKNSLIGFKVEVIQCINNFI